ncbi:ATP-binding protein [Streptomyces sp. ID03-2B]|uniref:ATP-binding protein n=1 Tax=Streptomyces TaxID=1883 RepID=UPI00099CCDDE|nr:MULTISPECIES: ATP-binding protein [Streptomyces]MCX4713620.1 ATP-binding protein [Streptomyces griseus]MDX3340753.1 ATP-binding protein [Streptomyces sp. ME02-6979.5a]MDX3594493.1 ATP-binding protein [Streptomyces sp. ID03-2B]
MPGGVPEARHRVQEAMRAWGEPAERIEAAALIVTELVTNAVQHTSTRRIRCRLLRSAEGVRICVWNRGRARIPAPGSPGDATGLPVSGVPAAADLEADDALDRLSEDGRGLLLVDALAARWGTRAALAGRLVWADI